MSHLQTRMAQEVAEAPEAVARQEPALERPLRELVASLRRRPPRVVVTCARGSSAHAATYGKHLIERTTGTPVAEAAPNIASVYHRQLNLKDQLFLAISQSGKSDDLIEMALSARAAGALTVAMINVADSPLERACDLVLPIGAGPELSVAASKTFVATLTSLQRLTAAWTGDAVLRDAIDALPGRLRDATLLDWDKGAEALSRSPSLVTIGRGPTLAIAREAALKLKETCNLHAEAFSGAEFLHGPVALAAPTYPILMLMPTDEAAAGMQQLAVDLRRKGTALLATGTAGAGAEAPPPLPASCVLPALPPRHPETDAVCLVQSFYAMLLRLAVRLGVDVDRPRHLQKVTRTR
jgi:glucosamine--fructose-6-phosphate aminotransferase (isomerizing)